jgi:hypothetical protein
VLRRVFVVIKHRMEYSWQQRPSQAVRHVEPLLVPRLEPERGSHRPPGHERRKLIEVADDQRLDHVDLRRSWIARDGLPHGVGRQVDDLQSKIPHSPAQLHGEVVRTRLG